MNPIVSARRHIDVLTIAVLLFLQMALDEVIDRAIEVGR